MKAVILAGGKGERLRPLTERCPKPLIKICEKEVLSYILDALREAGIDECFLTVGENAGCFERFLASRPEDGMRICLQKEEKPLGTAGSVRACKGLDGDTLVLGGDIIFDFDLAAFIAAHRNSGAAASLLLTRTESPTEYGLVTLDRQDRVIRFSEKPEWERVTTDLINTGIYLLSPDALAAIPPGVPYDFGKELFPAILNEGKTLYGHIAEGYWRDIGSPDAYLACTGELLSGACRRFAPPPAGILLPQGCEIAETAKILPFAVIGAGCRIGANAVIRESVIGEGCEIGEDAVIENSVLAPRCKVGRKALLREGTVLGEEASAAEGCRLSGQKIAAGKTGNGAFGAVFREGRLAGGRTAEFTAPFAARVGAAVGRYYRNLLIGYGDERSEALACAFGAGATDAGADVCFVSAATPSMTRFLTAFFPFTAGAHLRLTERGCVLTLYDEKGLPVKNSAPIEKAMEQGVLSGEPGQMRRLRDGRERYFAFASSLCRTLAGRRVEVDSDDPLLSKIAGELLLGNGAVVAPGGLRVWLAGDGERFSVTEDGEEYPDLCLLPLLFKDHAYAPDYMPRFGHRELASPDTPEGYRIAPDCFDNLFALIRLMDLVPPGEFHRRAKKRVYTASQSACPPDGRAHAMRRLGEKGEARENGIFIRTANGEARICPQKDREALLIFTAAVSAEAAEELCDECRRAIERQGKLDK